MQTAIRVAIVCLLFLLIVVASAFVTWFLYAGSDDVELVVPEVTGMTYAEAQSKLGALGLNVERRDVYDDASTREQVIAQLPRAGLRVRPGRVVRLTVSSGIPVIMVPDLTGLTLLEADNLLRRAGTAEYGLGGLMLGEELQVFSDSVPAGRIISQTPSYGETLQRGGAVDVIVSQGSEAEPISMPDVKGLVLEEAQRVIERAGLGVGTVITAASERDPEGVVLSQLPGYGSLVSAGESVTLTVNRARGPQRDPGAPRRIEINYTMPTTIAPQTLARVVVIDMDGMREIFKSRRGPGEGISLSALVRGKTTVHIYADEFLLDSWDAGQ